MSNTQLPKPVNLESLGLLQPERLPMSHQQEFDQQYITAKEIGQTIHITRAAIIRTMNRQFPSIKAAGSTFWKRTEAVTLFIKQWEMKHRGK